MPVSHLGLTVSHIPSATSFYLAALQPLGYRFLGKDGSTVGLGVENADFFLTEDTRTIGASPSHVAFCADSTRLVRDCYTSALKAGGHPNGSPAYCNDEGTAFNAAVEDLDGNTVEFIFREPGVFDRQDDAPPTVINGGDGESVPGTTAIVPSSTSSRIQSRAQAALDLASSTSGRLMKRRDDAVVPGISRAHTMPSTDFFSTREFPTKAVFGTLLGAAAGAAFAYAMHRSERESAYEEAAFDAALRQKTRRHSDASQRPKAEDLLEFDAAPSVKAKSQHRNYSVTETTPSMPRKPYSRRAITADYIDGNIERDAALGQRSVYERSLARTGTNYAPIDWRSTTTRDDPSGPRYTIKRASTFANDNQHHYYLEAPPARSEMSTTSSRRSSRRAEEDDQHPKRRDSAVSVHSSQHSHHSHHSHSSRPSHHSHHSRKSHRSSASTAKPGRPPSSHHNSAAEVPLPASRAASYISATQVPLPGSRASSYVTATQIPIRETAAARSWVEDAPYESDGLGDSRTVVPEDSISCVGLPPSKHRSSKSRHSSPRRSEAASERTLRADDHQSRHRSGGSRHSASKSLPVRSRHSRHEDDGRKSKRSVFSHA